MTSNKDDDFDPSQVNSTYLLFQHIAYKGLQAGYITLMPSFRCMPSALHLHKLQCGHLQVLFWAWESVFPWLHSATAGQVGG